MHNVNNMTQSPIATYVHETMCERDFNALSEGLNFIEFGDLLYGHVEYFNAPSGLIFFAHHNDFAGQVDGIHPACLSHSIENPKNIIEPLQNSRGGRFSNAPIAYNSHWMTRRSQGALLLAAFGRMIDSGDPEVTCIMADDDRPLSLVIFDAATVPVIGVIDYDGARAHLIRPAGLTMAPHYENRDLVVAI